MEYVSYEPNVDIPMWRLRESYRCHKSIAGLLKKWVYKEDNISFTSDLFYTIEDPEFVTGGMRKALNPDSPLVVILHNERESQQSNEIEAKIIKEISESLKEEIGVVTPHNAQKGLLKNELDDEIRVDTVERFQGGQSDVIILSGTVSDPDYVKAESEFILNKNRLNVALSMMKKKLIVIASKSIFEFVPSDAKDYKEALLWRGLYEEVNAAETYPVWSGFLEEFLTSSETNEDIEVEVHTMVED